MDWRNVWLNGKNIFGCWRIGEFSEDFRREALTAMIIGSIFVGTVAGGANAQESAADEQPAQKLIFPDDAIADLIRESESESRAAAGDESSRKTRISDETMPDVAPIAVTQEPTSIFEAPITSVPDVTDRGSNVDGAPIPELDEAPPAPASIEDTVFDDIFVDTGQADDVVVNDSAGDRKTKTPIDVMPEGRADPAMWRLADEDSEIWLLGTFHILPKGLDWRSDALARAADTAETFYFEAEVDNPKAQQQSVRILMTEGFNPNGVTLTGLLEPDDAKLLKRIADELKLPMAAIDAMRPWQAFLALSMKFIADQGFSPGSGVETALLREARLRGRNLRFFESVEEQIRLFTSLEPEVEKNLLTLTLREWETQENQFQDLFNAWRNGDTVTIDALMNDAMRNDAPQVYEALLAERNVAWAIEIDEIMSGSGKVLVAVGAAHLVGDGSVTDLLRKKGYDVARYGDGE